MIIAFTLSMPCNNSWNGKWSGDERLHVKTVKVHGKLAAFLSGLMSQKNYFSYSFGDGWVAAVSLKEVDAAEAKKLNAKSAGFCGYDWMIDSILADGDIYGPMKQKPEKAVTS